MRRLGLPPRAGDDPQARELIANADHVEPPVQIRDSARRRLLRVADDEALLAALGKQGNRLPVGRPLGRTDLAVEIDELHRLAAREREQPGLRLPGASGEKEEGLPVRREARAHVVRSPLVICSARPRVIGTRQSRMLVLPALDRPPRVDRGRSVGRDRQLRDEGLPQDVLAGEATLRHGAIMHAVRRSR